MEKNRAGHWLVVDLQRDSETLQAMARQYAHYAAKFPTLFVNTDISIRLSNEAKRLADAVGTVNALMAELSGSVAE